MWSLKEMLLPRNQEVSSLLRKVSLTIKCCVLPSEAYSNRTETKSQSNFLLCFPHDNQILYRWKTRSQPFPPLSFSGICCSDRKALAHRRRDASSSSFPYSRTTEQDPCHKKDSSVRLWSGSEPYRPFGHFLQT